MLNASNMREQNGVALGDHPVPVALDRLCDAKQQEEIARRAYTKARGLARRAETKVEKLEVAIGMRRGGRRS